MSKKSRDYLFWFFIVIFIVSTALISLYASGYKFNLSWPPRLNRLLIKTGMLIVKTQPAGATIYLNDQAQTSFSLFSWQKSTLTSPAKIKNVLPGDYDLRLAHDGYWPWQKQITIASGQTTFLEDINLFRSDLPIIVATSTAGDLELSPSRRYLYAAGAPKIIDLKNGQIWALPLPLNTAGRWLNSDRLLANGQLFDPTNGTTINYQQLLGAGAKNWYDDEPSNRLYYQNKNSLNYWDINKNANNVIVSGKNYPTYEPRGDNFFLVAVDTQAVTLQVYSLKTQKIEQSLNLPTVGSYRLVPDNNQFLTLYDEQNRTLYLLNPTDITNDPKTIKNVSDWQWPDDNTLIYNNSWEIYQLDLKSNSAALLTRVGTEIKKIIWNKSAAYLLFTTDQSLNAFDVKTGMTTTIFQADQISSPALDEKNAILYFGAQVGRQAGIYKMLLQ